MIIGATRSRFPRGLPSEAPEARRMRWEEWLIETRKQALAAPWKAHEEKDGQHLDPEYDAVMYQPGRTDGVSRPSVKLAVRSRCWQCVAGDSDEGGTVRIAECKERGCALWSVRPYQGTARVPRLKRADAKLEGISRNDHAGKALANPGNLRMAVRGYCQQCCGGQPDVLTMRDVKTCTTVICGLWRVRPGANSKNQQSGEEEAE